ncbi:hypothetical protein ACJMK2_038947 [Sinanodonta woodiana]|uniref:C2H2-type domain-containing protein n=1 Tax=Sinanodonta woodiana TaxID=1069815 RepID=A0ABD3WAI3_SINWO
MVHAFNKTQASYLGSQDTDDLNSSNCFVLEYGHSDSNLQDDNNSGIQNNKLQDNNHNVNICDARQNSQIKDSEQIVELNKAREISQSEDSSCNVDVNEADENSNIDASIQNVNPGDCSQNFQLVDTSLIFEFDTASTNVQLGDISQNVDPCDASRNSQLEESKLNVDRQRNRLDNVELVHCSRQDAYLHDTNQNGQLHDSSQNSHKLDLLRSSHEDNSITSCDLNSQKPSRYCMYCHQIITGGKLKRHILRKHKLEEEVKAAVLLPKQLQNKFFEDKRREGMYQFNIKFMTKPEMNETDKMQFMRERKPKYENGLRMYSGCKSFLSSRSFYKHKQACIIVTADAMKPKLFSSTLYHKDKEFVEEILNKFRTNEAGELCRTDFLIQQVGYRHFA